MSKYQIGKERYKILVKAEKDGRLGKCQSRFDVAKLVGYTQETRASGYMWCSGLINRGKLIEYTRFLTSDGYIHSYRLNPSLLNDDLPIKSHPNLVNRLTILYGDLKIETELPSEIMEKIIKLYLDSLHQN